MTLTQSELGQPPKGHALRGMTLLELTVVILVLLTLITILFIGAKAWKSGSDRALCIMHVQAVQKGIRSYSNLHNLSPGDTVANLQDQIIGPGRFVEAAPSCPSAGVYTFGQTYGNNTIPPIGGLYLQCSLASSDDHLPPNHSEW